MGNVIQAVRTNLDEESFDWMVGSSISVIVFLEPNSWRLHFSGGGLCSTEAGTWRLSTSGRIVASSDDHGHRFGLPAPVDTGKDAFAALGSALVLEARVGDVAPDLAIRFEGGLVLELLTLSRGYECWQACDPSGRRIVAHGSRDASTWQDPSTR